MFRDDYISRQIQIIVLILARILGLSKGREFIDALSLLRMTFRDQLGTDLDAFLTVPDDRMLDYLTFGSTEAVALMHSSMAIALLNATATVYEDWDKAEQGRLYFQKAVNLLLEVELSGEEPPVLPEFVPTVDEMLEGKDLHQLSLESRGTLVFYFEREGEYAAAERVLNTMLADRPDDTEIHQLAVSFYEYLLDEHDEKLAEGGLPREEILEKLEKHRLSLR
ncbi:MAG: hypothetical protein HUU38_20060 [Anaerolineales bacterium]|nr:hypothetical protein [Anaerolineales bacterium]